MEKFIIVVTQVLILFMLIAVGYLFGKLKKLTETGTKQIYFLLVNVVCPCLVINSLQIEKTSSLLKNMAIAACLIIIFYIFRILLSKILYAKKPEKDRAIFRYGITYGNTAFMGLPLISALFPSEALVYTAVAIALYNVFAFSQGVSMMGGKGQSSVKHLLLSPNIIAIAVGLVLFVFNIKLPTVPATVVQSFTALTTPLSMLLIGCQMSRVDLLSTVKNRSLYFAAAVKLIFLPVVAALIMLPLQLPSILYCPLVVLAGTPTAGMTSILAERYGCNPPLAAQLVSLSTLLCIVTLPLCATFAQFLSALA